MRKTGYEPMRSTIQRCPTRPHPQHPRRPGRAITGPGGRGLTLVELLVVLAVIGVLLGILLPTLSQARRAAETTTCISNLRQLHMALRMYEDDHGFLPVEPALGYFPKWRDQLSAYVKNDALYVCPLDPDPRAHYLGYDPRPCSYSYTYTMLQMGRDGVHRRPTLGSPVVLCMHHESLYQAIILRYDGSIHLPVPHRYREIGFESEDPRVTP